MQNGHDVPTYLWPVRQAPQERDVVVSGIIPPYHAIGPDIELAVDSSPDVATTREILPVRQIKEGSIPLPEAGIKHLGHFASKLTEVFSPVDAGKFVEQSRRHISLGTSRHAVRARSTGILAELCA
jgi:hypothetical protein